MKLTVTQSRYIMRCLKKRGRIMLDNIEFNLKAQMIPTPEASRDKLRKLLTKKVYDKPAKTVELLLDWCHGKEPSFAGAYHKWRSTGFDQVNTIMAQLRDALSSYLLDIEGKLMFADDWTAEYPLFLETDMELYFEELLAPVMDDNPEE